jgi:hypothetical protein
MTHSLFLRRVPMVLQKFSEIQISRRRYDLALSLSSRFRNTDKLHLPPTKLWGYFPFGTDFLERSYYFNIPRQRGKKLDFEPNFWRGQDGQIHYSTYWT